MPTQQIGATTMYTTETNGRGDLQAAAAHRKAVARMVHAANRRPCPAKCEQFICTHGLDDKGLGSAR